MEIDKGEAARFLAALSPDTEYTFQTFGEATRGNRSLNRILHGTLLRHEVALASLNLKGAGVFVMVNRGDLMGRKAANVTACRALFVDLDGEPLEPVLSGPVRPRIVVESSPERWHCYWPVTDLPPDRFSSAQKALALRFNGDPKVCDKPRVMRLPGFWHNKANPFRTRLIESSGIPLTWAEMVEAFDLGDRLRLPDRIHAGERNSTLFRLAASARQKGVPEAAQLAKALQVNERRCTPALSEGEVRATVANAYRYATPSGFSVPSEAVDSPQFKALDDADRLMVVLAYRRADGFNGGCVTLPWSELAEWFPREKTFYQVRARVVASGLLTVATPCTKAMPRRGRGPQPTFYKLAIPPVAAPYSPPRIPPVGAPPEALQVVALAAFDGSKAQGADSDPERSVA